MANGGPFAACALTADSDSNTTTYSNHPAYMFSWLQNGIAYSGKGITHSCYFSLLFMLAAFFRAIVKRTSILHGGKMTSTNHILVLLLVGMVLCLGVEFWRSISSPECLRGIWMFTDISTVDAAGAEGDHINCDISYLYFGLLPLLIFKPSFDIDYNYILRNIDTIIILGAATLLTLLITVTSFVTTTIEPFHEISTDSSGFPAYGEFRSFAFGGLLSIIICCTDATQLLSLLNELGGRQNRLATIIDMGSWLASALSLIIFELFRISVQASQTWHHTQWIWTISWKIIFSPLYGYFVCKIHGSLLGMIINDVLAEVLLILATLYFTFATASLMGLSGPVTILAYNVFFEHSTLSKDGEIAVKKFCEAATFFAGVYLAGTAGFVWLEELWDSIDFINQDSIDVYTMNYLMKDLIWIVVLYIIVTSVRIVVLMILTIFLRNDTISWKESILMSWGQIPGPVNIVMALIALLDPNLNWIPGCSAGRFNPANPYGLSSSPQSRVIGDCDGDVIIENMTYMLDTTVPKSQLSELYGIAQQKVFFYGVGVLILAQLINGLSLNSVLYQLGIYKITKGQKSTMANALTKIRQDVVAAGMSMRYDAFLADADWDHVILKSHLSYPYRQDSRKVKSTLTNQSVFTRDGFVPSDPQASDSGLEVANSDVDKHFEEARQRSLNALKTSFAKQRNKGLLTDEAVTVLRQAVDSVQNDPSSVQFVSINQLKRNWKLFGIIPKFKNMIETHLYGNNEKEIRNPWRKRWVRKCHKAALSTWLEIVMQIVIMLNLVLMIVERVLERKKIIYTTSMLEELEEEENGDAEWENYNKKCEETICGREIMESISYVFIAIYVVEVAFKGLSLGGRQYFSSRWNQFDFAIAVISIVEAVASAVIQTMILDTIDEGGKNKGEKAIVALKSIKMIKLIKSLKAIRALRIARLLRFSKTVIPWILNAINTRIASRIRFGYDVGRGYIKGVEELDSALEMIAGDAPRTKKRLRQMSEKSKSQVVRDLGLLQRSYPGIATSVKTKTAIRNMINVMLDSVQRLQSGGVLDDFEVRVLHDQINILVKSLASIPLIMPTPDPQNLFLNIHWVSGDKKLAAFLKDSSQLCDFDLNDFIIQDDEEPDAIYLIISGMVRIVHGQYREKAINDSDLSITGDFGESEENQVCDYASTGIVVGEMGCLVGENAHMSVICETAVQTYQIPVEVIREAYTKFPKLLDTLWSVVGMKIAIPLLQKDYKFQGYTPEELRRHLQSNYVANYEKGSEIQFNSDISEIILLDGSVIFMNEFVESPALLSNDRFEFEDGFKSGGGKSPTIVVQEAAVVLVIKTSKNEIRSRNGASNGNTVPNNREIAPRSLGNGYQANVSVSRVSSRIIRNQESRSAICSVAHPPFAPDRQNKRKTTINEDDEVTEPGPI